MLLAQIQLSSPSCPATNLTLPLLKPFGLSPWPLLKWKWTQFDEWECHPGAAPSSHIGSAHPVNAGRVLCAYGVMDRVIQEENLETTHLITH